MLFNNVFRQHQLQSKTILCWFLFVVSVTCDTCEHGHTHSYKQNNLQGGREKTPVLNEDNESFFKGNIVKYRSG